MPKRAPSIPPPPLAVIQRAKSEFGVRSVIVGISGGKDSLATLSLCAEHFSIENVRGYFMYLCPGLSFQENYLAYLERRFAPLRIHRIPHFGLAQLFRSGTFRYLRNDAIAVPALKPRHYDAYLRKLTGLHWIATGEKAIDSVERNAMIRHAGGIDPKRGRIWPLAYWSHSTVYNYLKTRQIPLPPEYSLNVGNQTGGRRGAQGHSFGNLWYQSVVWIRDKYPDDYEKIVRSFPFLPGQVLRWQERERRAAEQGAVQDGQEEAK
jgi:phosphoadenosine phosphosulfate reductase